MKTAMAMLPDEEQRSRSRIKISSIPASSAHTSIARGASLVAASELLSQIDHVGESATGALVIGGDPKPAGAILVEKGRICWAMAEGLTRRLTDILRHQSEPPLDTARLDEVFRECRESRQPFGETLVERGLITPAGLRSGLRQHTAEAVAVLSRTPATSEFRPHRRQSYDPKFSFSPTEILASLGAVQCPDLALKARTALRVIVQDIATGAVFARNGGSAILLGVQEKHPFSVEEVGQVQRWALGQLDVSKAVSPGLETIAGSDRHGRAIVAWQDDQLIFIAICADSKAMARVLMGASRR